jgi:hypothetical protein
MKLNPNLKKRSVPTLLQLLTLFVLALFSVLISNTAFARSLPFTYESIETYEAQQLEAEDTQDNLAKQRAYLEEHWQKVKIDNDGIRHSVEVNKIDGTSYEHLIPLLQRSDEEAEKYGQSVLAIQQKELEAKNESVKLLLIAKRGRILNEITQIHNLKNLDLSSNASKSSEINQKIHFSEGRLAGLKAEVGEVHQSLQKDRENRFKNHGNYPLTPELEQQFQYLYDDIESLEKSLDDHIRFESQIHDVEAKKIQSKWTPRKILAQNEIRVLKEQEASLAATISDFYHRHGALEESNYWSRLSSSLYRDAYNMSIQLIILVLLGCILTIGSIVFLVLRNDLANLKKFLKGLANLLLNKELQGVLPQMIQDLGLNGKSRVAIAIATVKLVYSLVRSQIENGEDNDAPGQNAAGDVQADNPTSTNETESSEDEDDFISY